LRERRGRLRAGPFGSKHYFTVRNRIAVARRYTSLPSLAGCLAVAFGIVLWLACLCRHPRRGAVHILLRAIRDGWHARLGPFRPGTSP
jgi:rhamnopyranosyl-N-acetylglucosaminyl-diphospho-decaprenol beta-1,3/1,4-galactofuranosyltransferase